MAEDHVAVLRKARDQMVGGRRKAAEALAEQYHREVTPGARDTLIKIQETIEAIDRAIEDESNNPHYVDRKRPL